MTYGKTVLAVLIWAVALSCSPPPGDDAGTLDTGRDVAEVFDVTLAVDMPPDTGAGDASVADLDTPDDGPGPDISSDLPPQPPPCEREDTIFCDSFEDGTLDDEWGTTEELGAVEVTDELAYDGTEALRAETFIPGGIGAIFRSLDEPIPDGEMVWLRFRLYLASGDLDTGVEIVQIGNRDDEIIVLFMEPGEVHTHTHFRVGGVEFDRSIGMPEDRWACVEWGVQFGEDGGVIIAIDDQELVNESGLGEALVADSEFFVVRLGLVSTPNDQTPLPVYFDDVYLGYSRPGCD